MSIKQTLLSDLKRMGLAPNHRFGQNFMIDEQALNDLLEAADLQSADRIIEIGPGTGILTKRILDNVDELMAVEIDQGMARLLNEDIQQESFRLVHGDALANKNNLHQEIEQFAQRPWKLVANLPYDVSLPIILNALALPLQPQCIVVTVQKEAAERLCASPKTKLWGASAAVAQSVGEGRIVRNLNPECFYPKPRVQSVILQWQVQQPMLVGFSPWIRGLFAFRRKVIPRALRDTGIHRDKALAVCASLGLDAGQRVEELAVSDLQALFHAVQALE